MKSRLVVVADLGRFKAYRLEESRRFRHPRLHLVEDWDTNITQHLRQEVTDQAGQFRKGPTGSQGTSAVSDGEQHNLDLERRRRALKLLARHVSEVLKREQVDGCYRAADKRINQHLSDEMQPEARSKIQKNVPADLSKLSPEEVLKQFCE